jgi:hypothetical protein
VGPPAAGDLADAQWPRADAGAGHDAPAALPDSAGQDGLAPDVDAGTAADCTGCGHVGAVCSGNNDCASGLCVEVVPGYSLCTQECVEECPEGFTCKLTGISGPDVISVCVPEGVVSVKAGTYTTNICNGTFPAYHDDMMVGRTVSPVPVITLSPDQEKAGGCVAP